MRYTCPACLGAVEIDGMYEGQEMGCPHCNTSVVFKAEAALVSAPPKMEYPALAHGADAEAIGQVRSYCTEGEHLMHVVAQSKVVGFKPDIIAATDRRLLILRRGLLSQVLWDVLWIDVADVKISESIFGAEIAVHTTQGRVEVVGKLPKEPARSLYRYCQAGEEQMRAARHASRLATLAAGAGRINVSVNHGTPPPIP